MTTNLLSKRWRYLWKHVPKLEYKDPSRDSEHWRASRFVDKFLLLHKSPVLETLHLTLNRNCPSIDIETFIPIAVSSGVCNLKIIRRPGSGQLIRCPRVLYTCETLVTLKLLAEFSVNDVPLTICFRSLKVLVLVRVQFSSDEIVQRILSGCPVLKELKVVRGSNDNLKIFTIAVPSLQRLTIIDWKCGSHVPGDDVGFVINAPSLKSLTIANQFSWCYSLVSMPYLVKANIKLRHGDSKIFKGLLISAKHVSLCLQPPTDSCSIGVFNQLVSLNLCTCSVNWCHLILRHTPKLLVLRFELKQVRAYRKQIPVQRCCSSSVDFQTHWEPTSVPKCLISSLGTVKWFGYKGTQVEEKVVMYLLKNSGQLKRMAIRSLKSATDKEKFKMLQALSSTQRSSTKCRFWFT